MSYTLVQPSSTIRIGIKWVYGILLAISFSIVKGVEQEVEFPAFGIAIDRFPSSAQDLDHATQSIGLRPLLYNFYLQWPDNNVSSQKSQLLSTLEAIRAAGAIPVMTWEPMIISNRKEHIIGADFILSGKKDSYIRLTAQICREFGGIMILRFAHEMNLSRYHWPETQQNQFNANSPQRYISVYRYIWDLFHQEGATNILWAFCPNAESLPPENLAPWNAMEQYYPGNQYVDIVGIDGYNWGDTQTVEQNEWQSKWRSFSEIFATPIVRLRILAPEKPLIIFETATAASGGNKIEWLREAWSWAAHQKIIAIIWFDIKKEIDWRLKPATFSNSIDKIFPSNANIQILRKRLKINRSSID